MKLELKKYTGRCQKCDKKLLSYCWKFCNACDPKTKIKKELKLYVEEVESQNYMGYHHTLDLNTFLKAKTFMVDHEKMKILGYRNF